MMERTVDRFLTVLALVSAVVFSILTVVALVWVTLDASWSGAATFMVSLILAVLSGLAAVGVAGDSDENESRLDVERKLLNHKQRSELRKARGAVLYEEGMFRVQQEHAALAKKQIERGSP